MFIKTEQKISISLCTQCCNGVKSSVDCCVLYTRIEWLLFLSLLWLFIAQHSIWQRDACIRFDTRAMRRSILLMGLFYIAECFIRNDKLPVFHSQRCSSFRWYYSKYRFFGSALHHQIKIPSPQHEKWNSFVEQRNVYNTCMQPQPIFWLLQP